MLCLEDLIQNVWSTEKERMSYLIAICNAILGDRAITGRFPRVM